MIDKELWLPKEEIVMPSDEEVTELRKDMQPHIIKHGKKVATGAMDYASYIGLARYINADFLYITGLLHDISKLDQEGNIDPNHEFTGAKKILSKNKDLEHLAKAVERHTPRVMMNTQEPNIYEVLLYFADMTTIDGWRCTFNQRMSYIHQNYGIPETIIKGCREFSIDLSKRAGLHELIFNHYKNEQRLL